LIVDPNGAKANPLQPQGKRVESRGVGLAIPLAITDNHHNRWTNPKGENGETPGDISGVSPKIARCSL
jgi:hypothetical protein